MSARTTADVFRKPWAILPERLRSIALRAVSCTSRDRPGLPAISAGKFARGGMGYGTAAVIPIRGVISHHANFASWIFGGTSIDKLTAQFRRALNDPGVKAIVFDIDSPGGSVEGVQELADEIYKSRSRKKTVAVANVMAASAAYWLAASAGELVVAPSGEAGSIGVFAIHEDVSAMMEKAGVNVTLIGAGKYKTDGNPFQRLSDTARADLQGKVNAFHEMFVQSVARGRRASADRVRGRFGQGRMVLAEDAVKAGMADRVATMDEVLARISSGRDDGDSSIASIELLRERLRLRGAGPGRVEHAAGVPIDVLRQRLAGRI